MSQEFIKAEIIRRKLIEKYNRNPWNWKIFVSTDRNSFINTLVLHDEESWLIKEYLINPFKSVGVGARLSPPRSNIQGKFNFGFRPISDSVIKRILEENDKEKRISILNKVLSTKPMSLSNIKSNFILGGPIYYAPRSILEEISPSQRKLDEKLRRELNKILRKEYPHLFTPYV